MARIRSGSSSSEASTTVDYFPDTDFTHPLTSSVTFADATGYSFEIGANEKRRFRMVLRIDGSADADVKLRFTGPAGGDITFTAFGLATSSGADGGANRFVSRQGFDQSSGGFGLVDAATQAIEVEGVATGGPTGGTVQLQTGQNTAHITAHIIRSGSNLSSSRV